MLAILIDHIFQKHAFSWSLKAVYFIICFSWFNVSISFSQSSRVLVQNAKGNSFASFTLNVKWYNQQLIYKKGVNIYRKETGESDWTKLNISPILIQPTVPPALLQRDEDLQMFVDMAKEMNVAEEDGFLLLSLFGKSFQSADYSRLIGIQYDDRTAAWGKTYQYRVMKLEGNKEIELAVSPIIKAGDYEQEDSIQDLSIALEKNIARMKWREEEARYYGVNVYRSTKTNPEWSKVNPTPVVQSESEEGPKAEIMFEDDSLKEGTVYYYRLAGLDFFGEETALTASREIRVGDLTPPPPPMNPKKSVKMLNVSISWNTQSVSDLAGFHVYRSNKSDGQFVRISNILIPKTETIYMDPVPQPDFYYYYVAAVDNSGNESNSFTVLAEVQDVIPPLPPSKLIAKADTGKVILSWKANAEPDIMGYHIFRAISEASDSQFVLINSEPLTDTTYTQVFAKNASNKFLFKVIAVDTSFNRSEPSESVSARMPDITAPITPVIKNIIVRGDSLIIQWLANPEPDLKSFTLLRSEKNVKEEMHVVSGSIDPKARQYSDTVYVSGKYYYQLQAVDESGNRSSLSELFPIIKSSAFRFTFSEVKGKYKKLKKSVFLAWSVKGAAKGYSVFRKKIGEETVWKPLTSLIKSNEFVDMSTVSKSMYQYQVRAYSQSGEVVVSDPLNFKTK